MAFSGFAGFAWLISLPFHVSAWLPFSSEAPALPFATPPNNPEPVSEFVAPVESDLPLPVSRQVLSGEGPGHFFDVLFRTDEYVPKDVFKYKEGPYPTNAWWENFASASNPESESASMFQMPYVIMSRQEALHAMLPSMGEGHSQSYDRSSGVTLGMAGDTTGIVGPYAADWDDLSVTLGWRNEQAGTWAMQAPLVRGSPFVTAKFDNVIPKLSSVQGLRPHHGAEWVMVDGQHHVCDGSTPLKGKSFVFDLKEHDTTWMMFAPVSEDGTPMEFMCQAVPFSLTATGPHIGAVRIALANDCVTGLIPQHCEGAPHGKDASQYASLLVSHAAAYPTGATVEFFIDSKEDRRGVMTWVWDLEYLNGWEQRPLVQLAWPVHKPLLSSHTDEVHASTPFKDVRGATVLVVGDRWNLNYDLMPDVGFKAFQPIDPAMKKEMLETLKGPLSAKWDGGLPDREFELPLKYELGMGDTYFGGKLVGRLAQLITIADELGESNEPYFKDMVERLAFRVQAWLKRDSMAPFIYDDKWGGMLSCGCDYEDCAGMCEPRCKDDRDFADPTTCPAMKNFMLNFGNTLYNDHHFHYGYWVYAAAVLAKYDPVWELTWREQVLTLVRDYANPSPEDLSFPVVRHKDFFLGFSWAGGLGQGEARGRNQESTSEAVNAYYALYVYGAAVEHVVPWGKNLKNLGRIWAAMEAHGAETYWQIREDSEVYDGKDFAGHVIGILWEHKATEETWFGKHAYEVSGIQILPITPATETYLKVDFVNQHFNSFRNDCASEPECHKGWEWTVCMEQAIIDRMGAIQCLNRLAPRAFSTENCASNGQSLLNSLYWVATRPEPTADSRVRATSLPKAESLPLLESEEQQLITGEQPLKEPVSCREGSKVFCPGSELTCLGDTCCEDGSTCPSAANDFEGCSRAKLVDCTADNPKYWIEPPPPTSFSKRIEEALKDGTVDMSMKFAVSAPSPGANSGVSIGVFLLASVFASFGIGLTQWRRRNNEENVCGRQLVRFEQENAEVDQQVLLAVDQQVLLASGI